MSIKQAFFTALRNLQADKTYLGQTMLGVAAGVAALLAVLVVIQGMFCLAWGIEAEYSPNMLRYMVQTRAGANRFTPEDMQQLVADNPDLYTATSPEIPVYEGIKYGDRELGQEFAAVGVSQDYAQIVTAIQLAQGRWLQHLEVERGQRVCVVGSSVADLVLGQEALGQNIRIQGEDYTVVGVLAEVIDDMQSINQGIYIPYTNAAQMKNDSFMPSYYENGGYFDVFYFNMAEGADKQRAYRTIYDLRQAKLDKDAMSGIFSSAEYSNLVYSAIAPTIVMLGLFAAVVLLVGGAGIMNVMLLAVSRRQPEIGLRKAFGATQRDIKRQFGLEAACTGVLGGLAGLALGLPAGWLGCQVAYIPFKLAFLPAAAVTALAAAIGLGLVFGSLPARQAAQMEPVAAINSN